MWINNDNLVRKFGTEQADLSVIGEFRLDGPFHTIELALDLTTLTQTETILDYNYILPKGAVIQSVDVLPLTAAATGTAIDVGLIKASDKTTEYDYNGILAAFPTGSMTLGTLTTLSNGVGTYDGAQMGVALTEACFISASMTDATAFTAGDIRIRINYVAT